MAWLRSRLTSLRARGKVTLRAPLHLPERMSPIQIVVLAACSLGIGLFPIAPATLASGMTALLAYWLRGRVAPPALLAAVLVVMLIGVALGTAAEKLFGCDDPRQFILDEVAGQLLVFVFLPATCFNAVGGFVLFRVFDILKVPPADRLERLHGGWGIMADDLVAGLYAAGALWAATRVLSLPG